MTPAAHAAALALAFATGQRVLHFFFSLGLFGLFFISIVDSSFVPLPIPGVTDVMVILYAANHANVIFLVLITTLGSAVGGLFSHAVGQVGGMAFLEKHVPVPILKRVTSWMERHAIIAVALPALLPPPAPLSPFVLAAGAVRMSRRTFMTAFTLSRLARHCIAAWLGIHYGKAVLQLWARFSARWGTLVLSVFWTVTLVFTAIAIWKLYKTSRAMDIKPGAKIRAQVASAGARRREATARRRAA